MAEHGDGAVTKVCVSFAGDQITGAQLLDLSHVPYSTVDYGSYGKAVCQIEGEPASYPPSCWTASSPYWAVFVTRGSGVWQTSSLGISSQTFRDGDAEGFRYEPQSDNSTPASPAGACPPPVPDTPTPATTSTPVSARPGATGVAGPHSPSPVPVRAAAGAVTPTPAATTPAPASPGGSWTPAAVGQVRVADPPRSTPGAAIAGVWIASLLGASLIALLVVQVRRSRARP